MSKSGNTKSIISIAIWAALVAACGGGGSSSGSGGTNTNGGTTSTSNISTSSTSGSSTDSSGGNSSSSGTTNSGSSTSGTTTPPVQMACSDVTTAALALPNLVITAATSMPALVATDASKSYPAHCKLTGAINARTGLDGLPYAIGFEIHLPTTGWNGKFAYSGEGGLAGSVQDPLGRKGWGGSTNSLLNGFAVASSDSGHIGSSADGSFGLDPQARADYGYNALGTLTPLAKSIVQKFYGVAPSYSYYQGGSKGGQTGMMAASRFASEFDGILAGQPAMDLHKAALGAIYGSQQFATLDPALTNAFTAADLKLVAKKILNQCDLLDGAADQMVNDITACKTAFTFATDVPQCASGFTPDGTCLSAAQKTVLGNIFAGVKNSSGTSLYSDWPWDPGIIGVDWTTWKTATAPQLGATLMANIITIPPLAPITSLSAAISYNLTYDFDTALASLSASNTVFTQSATQNFSMPTPYALTTLKAHGKLLVFHGTADPIVSVNYTLAWYAGLLMADPTAASYARLFLVPGMNHGGGGPSTDAFDAMTPLIQWVENSVVPKTIIAGIAPGNPDIPASWSPARTRPLCAYPKKAILVSGATDLESAASFVCQ